MDYDLVVVGSGPAGQKAAIQGAKLGRRVAIVERQPGLGGVCMNTGTIPSKTLREAVLYLSGVHQRGFYGVAYMAIADATAISFTGPLFATVGAALILKETVRLRRWTATLVGFAGVLVIVQPGPLAHDGPLGGKVSCQPACSTSQTVYVPAGRPGNQ